MWKTVKLGDVCNVRRGTTITKKQTGDGNVPVVAGGIKPNYYHNQVNRDGNCITVSGSGANAGFVNYWSEPIFASDCSTVEPFDNNQNRRFIYYYLLSRQQYVYDNFRSGAAQPHVYAKDIATLEYPLIPISEQRRIVAKLDAAFAEIDKAIKATAKSKKYAISLRIRKIDEEIQSLKIDHEVGKIKDICDGVEYGTSAKCKSIGKYPVLRMGNIQNGKFDYSELVYLDDEAEAVKYRLRKYDVLFNRTNSPLHVGKSALFEGTLNASFAGYLIRINYDKERISPHYLNFYLNSKTVREFGYRVMTSSVNQANINGSKLKKYPFILVSVERQKKLVGLFSELEERINELCEIYESKEELLFKLKSAFLSQELPREAA